jgi:hypothetical protein
MGGALDTRRGGERLLPNHTPGVGANSCGSGPRYETIGISAKGMQMSESSSARILIVANRTAATPALIEAVRDRARRGLCSFALLVPQLPSELPFGDEEARKTLELAIPLLEEAAGGMVTGMLGPADALLAVERTLIHEHFDEVIISTLPARVSHWLKRDLPTQVERLQVPVTVVRAKEARRPLHEPLHFAGP